MQKLGYIISKTAIKEVPDFIEAVSDASLFYADKPALIVGSDFARKNVENFSIIKRNPQEGKFWTFGRRERREDFEKDVEKFYSYVLEDSINKIKYYYVNVLKLNRRRIIDLLVLLKSNDRKWVYIYKDMLYLYHRDYVLGISLKILKYTGINIKKHFGGFLKNKNLTVFFNDYQVTPYMKIFSKNKKYLVPYFLSLME